MKSFAVLLEDTYACIYMLWVLSMSNTFCFSCDWNVAAVWPMFYCWLSFNFML